MVVQRRVRLAADGGRRRRGQASLRVEGVELALLLLLLDRVVIIVGLIDLLLELLLGQLDAAEAFW